MNDNVKEPFKTLLNEYFKTMGYVNKSAVTGKECKGKEIKVEEKDKKDDGLEK